MSRRDMLDVVVVGAGVVGASAALAFARDGLQVALVEAREPSPWRADEPDLRVYAFAPDNAALLDRLLHHAVVVQIDGASYRLRHHADLIPEHTRSHATITPPPPPKRRGRPPKNGGANHMHG